MKTSSALLQRVSHECCRHRVVILSAQSKTGEGNMADPAPAIDEGQLDFVEFRGKQVRRVLYEDEWHFSVVDVIEAVTESPRPRQYWTDLKRKLADEGADEQVYANIVQLKMLAADGRERPTDAADTETMFRIVQSVSSKKAEPIKRWLAKVGYERILESQNPSIAIKRAIINYKILGYDDEWITQRVKSIDSRHALTSEWSKRGVKKGPEFGVLTNVVQKETFGIEVKQHRGFKGLKKAHNLRDHMTNTELALTTLGEVATKDIAVAKDAQGFGQNKNAAHAGGKVAGDARRALEEQTNKEVISNSNFLPSRNQKKLGK